MIYKQNEGVDLSILRKVKSQNSKEKRRLEAEDQR